MTEFNISQKFNTQIVKSESMSSNTNPVNQNSKNDKGISTGIKIAIGTSLAALASYGIYIATRGKGKTKTVSVTGNSTQEQKIKELALNAFKKIGGFNNGKAVLTDGTNYTGKIISQSKDSSKIVMEYTNGILQKSTKTSKDGTKIFEKVYTYSNDNKISKIQDLVGNSEILSREIKNNNNLYTRTSKSNYLQDMSNGKLLYIKGKSFYYDTNGLLKYTQDKNNLITAYYPNGKVKFLQDIHGIKFYDEAGKELAYYKADFLRGAKTYAIKYPDREIHYDITNSVDGIPIKQMKYYDQSGECKLKLCSSKNGYQYAIYKPENRDIRFTIEKDKNNIVNIIKDEILATYNSKTGEIIIKNNSLTRDTVSNIINELKNAISSVKKAHKQVLKMRDEYYKTQITLLKQPSENHYVLRQ